MKCCNKYMIPTRGNLGNGWECKKCGKFVYDVASVKMSGNYAQYIGLSNNHVNPEDCEQLKEELE